MTARSTAWAIILPVHEASASVVPAAATTTSMVGATAIVFLTLQPSAARTTASRYFTGNEAGRLSSSRIRLASFVAGSSSTC